MTNPFPRRPPAGISPTSTSKTIPCGGFGRPRILLSAALLAGVCLQAPPVLAEHFTPPSLEGFTLHSERDADGDADGVNETHILQYVNMHGDSLFSMTTKGRLWAWSLDTRDSQSGPSNYVIRDSDCDGVFDEVYGLDEEFHVPECLK